jgi:DNA-binding protein HU-beta
MPPQQNPILEGFRAWCAPKEHLQMAVAASSKPKAAKPVTTKHLAAALSEQHQLTKKQGLEMMDDLIGMITKHLKKGERVKISGLGILLVRNRAARMGRNPMTGEAIKIKASKKVAFRASKDLKIAI